jgi:hypothetical protein
MTETRVRDITVEQLVERLGDLPGYLPVMVEVYVGGDIGTDPVPLHEVVEEGCGDHFVTLRPDPADPYQTRTLIDEAIVERELAQYDDVAGTLAAHRLYGDFEAGDDPECRCGAKPPEDGWQEEEWGAWIWHERHVAEALAVSRGTVPS